MAINPLSCVAVKILSEVLDLLLKSRIAAIDIVGPLSVYAVWYAFSITGNVLFYCRMPMLSDTCTIARLAASID